jgi:hypothetical protein
VNSITLLARRALPGCLALSLSALAGHCAALSADGSVDALRLSGFGSLGVAHVDAPEGWVYRHELSQPLNSSSTRLDLDSRLGLQVNYTPSSAFELVGQAILMRRASAAERTDLVEWAFAAYRPNADWTLRLGRVNMDIFLMSDHRSVGFAYPLARPPVEFYGQLPSSLDGADATRVWSDGNAQWRAKLFSGRSKLAFNGTDKLDLVVLVGVGHGGHAPHLDAERRQRLVLLGRLVVRHDDQRAVTAREAQVRERDARIAGRALDHRAARLEATAALGILDDGAGRAILDGPARIHELGLAEDLATRRPRGTVEADQRGVADGAGETFDDAHPWMFAQGRVRREAAQPSTYLFRSSPPE